MVEIAPFGVEAWLKSRFYDKDFHSVNALRQSWLQLCRQVIH